MGVAQRNADGMDQCQVRIPKGLLEKIDDLVSQNKFSSRADFFRTIFCMTEEAQFFITILRSQEGMDILRDILLSEVAQDP